MTPGPRVHLVETGEELVVRDYIEQARGFILAVPGEDFDRILGSIKGQFVITNSEYPAFKWTVSKFDAQAYFQEYWVQMFVRWGDCELLDNQAGLAELE